MQAYDFCVVSPHGAGLQSFLYYLYKMGVPSTLWWSQKEDLLQLRQQYPICGITIDKALFNRREEFALHHNVPVFWLVRDPIALITSCVNQTIGDALCKTMTGVNAADNTLAWKKHALKFIENAAGDCCSYAEQLQRIKNFSSLTVIDTMSLLPDKICATMRKVTEILHVPYQESAEQYFTISYNCFSNRTWQSFPQYTFKSSIGNANFYIHPSELYDFILYRINKPLALFHFQYQRKGYTAASTDFFCEFTFHKTEIAKIMHSVILRSKLIAKLTEAYQKYAVSKDTIVDFIKSNPYIKDTFLKRQQPSINLLKKHAPAVLSQWGYFMKLL